MLKQETLNFIHDLKINNNKEWFHASKNIFNATQTDLIAFLQELLPIMAAFDASVAEIQPKDTLFRIYRDTRFTNDKSPYKTNFGAYFIGTGKNSGGAGYYIHIEPDACFLGGGIYSPDSKTLQKIRQGIMTDHELLRNILQNAVFRKNFGSLYGEQLKSAPRGTAIDHPAIDLLRHKHFTVIKEISGADVLSKKFLKTAIDLFQILQPFNDFLNNLLK